MSQMQEDYKGNACQSVRCLSFVKFQTAITHALHGDAPIVFVDA